MNSSLLSNKQSVSKFPSWPPIYFLELTYLNRDPNKICTLQMVDMVLVSDLIPQVLASLFWPRAGRLLTNQSIFLRFLVLDFADCLPMVSLNVFLCQCKLFIFILSMIVIYLVLFYYCIFITVLFLPTLSLIGMEEPLTL